MSWRLHPRIKSLSANGKTYRYPNLYQKVTRRSNPFPLDPCQFSPFYYRNDDDELTCYTCFIKERSVDEWIDAITGLHSFETISCESGKRIGRESE